MSKKNKNKNKRSIVEGLQFDPNEKVATTDPANTDNKEDTVAVANEEATDGEYYPDVFEEAETEYELSKDGSFGAFIKEFIIHVKELIIANKAIVTVLACIIVVIAAIIIILHIGGSRSDGLASISGNGTISGNLALEVPQDPYEIDAYPEVNKLINEYFTAKQNGDIDTIKSLRNYVSTSEAFKIEVLSEYYEYYQDITCYTKKGPFENSYIVYVSANLKLTNYDVLAPYLVTYVVCTADDGSLYLYTSEFDENVGEYIQMVSSQDDVKDLFSRVDTEYNDVIASNPEFAEYTNVLKDIVKEEVAKRLAEVASVSEDAVSENTVSANETVSENEVEETTFQVKATTTVNVRASDSEDADKLGSVTGGTVLTCNEERPNGWSEVIFEDGIGYIKTEYLERIETNAPATGNGTTVRCNDTVNIRQAASTDAASLGVAYVGDSFELVEHMSNGWSKIVYNGSEAYVKTEFLD